MYTARAHHTDTQTKGGNKTTFIHSKYRICLSSQTFVGLSQDQQNPKEEKNSPREVNNMYIYKVDEERLLIIISRSMEDVIVLGGKKHGERAMIQNLIMYKNTGFGERKKCKTNRTMGSREND